MDGLDLAIPAQDTLHKYGPCESNQFTVLVKRALLGKSILANFNKSIQCLNREDLICVVRVKLSWRDYGI